MAHLKSSAAKGLTPVPYPNTAGEAVVHRYTITIPATAAIGDIAEIACIPATTRPTDIVVDVTGAIEGDIGVLSGDWASEDTERTIGDEFATGAELSAAALFRPTKPSAVRVPQKDTARGIGLKITTAPTAAVTVGITLTVVA